MHQRTFSAQILKYEIENTPLPLPPFVVAEQEEHEMKEHIN